MKHCYLLLLVLVVSCSNLTSREELNLPVCEQFEKTSSGCFCRTEFNQPVFSSNTTISSISLVKETFARYMSIKGLMLAKDKITVIDEKNGFFTVIYNDEYMGTVYRTGEIIIIECGV